MIDRAELARLDAIAQAELVAKRAGSPADVVDSEAPRPLIIDAKRRAARGHSERARVAPRREVD